MKTAASQPRAPLGPTLPSRHSNPFATCWTKPGALPFQFSNGENAQRLIDRLTANNWWGEIVGPHGSGKSTLLETLKPLLAATGREVAATALRDRQRCLPRGFLSKVLSASRPLVIVDGYEQLSGLNQVWLKRRCRKRSAGLLVTSHAPTGLPPLIRLQPEVSLVEQLVADLTAARPSSLSTRDIVASHARYGSNIRELFFDLYDRHEAASRAIRTGPTATA
jgi:energy-coupling factor transporter ATP-binding protein EcfA2